jgi:hydroxypyruvate isomerase
MVAGCNIRLTPNGTILYLPWKDRTAGWIVMAWALRYASHLGYRTSDAPLFRESVGSLDPLAHVAFAAELGFAGVQYALARSRPVAEQEAVVDALARHGLETGCVIYTTRDKLAAPLWARTDGETRAVLNRELAAGFEAATRVNSRYVAVLSGADPRLPISEQRDAMAEKLRWAAPLAERARITLLLEFISTRSVANLLLHHIEDAHAMVKAVDSPVVRLIFDTGHVQALDGDLLAHLDSCGNVVELVQIADNPRRLEPGAGEINFETIRRELYRRSYRDLVELEHNWSELSRTTEQRGIAYLRRLDELIGSNS